MSPSHTATDPHSDPAAMHGLDFLVSLLVHALVVAVIVSLALWESRHTPEPLQRIQVSMVTPAQLDRMIRRAAKPAPRHENREPRKPQPKPEMVRPKPSAMPSLSKHVRKKAKPEKPFDPFAPLESTSDRTTAPAHSNNSTMANMQMQQLSQQEINRYIAMIQAAVARHWKVPLSLGHVSNPLVELKLNADGSVASIRILEGSGDAALDASLSRAIRAAAPFQLPPKQFEAFSDMKIRFVPEVNQQQ